MVVRMLRILRFVRALRVVKQLGVPGVTVSREWKNGSNSSCNCTPFLHSLLTKGKLLEGSGVFCRAACWV